MAEDWKPGDLAECINVSDIPFKDREGFPSWSVGGRSLKLGMLYLVQGTGLSHFDSGELVLDIGLSCGAKLARRFRKVPPIESDPQMIDRCVHAPQLETIDG